MPTTSGAAAASVDREAAPVDGGVIHRGRAEQLRVVLLGAGRLGTVQQPRAALQSNKAPLLLGVEGPNRHVRAAARRSG